MRRGTRRLVALAGAALMASCSTSPQPPARPAEEPTRGGRVTVGVFDQSANRPDHLQPALGWREEHALVYEPLVFIDRRSALPTPRLATWRVSADALTYTLQLREATWSDGVQITPHDWVTTVKAAARSKTTSLRGSRNAFQGIVEIVGLKEYAEGAARGISGITVEGSSLTVRVSDPFCDSLLRLFTIPPIPTHVFGKYLADDDPARNLDSAPENLAPPVASGPFVLKEWRPREQAVFIRNERYHAGAAYLDEIALKFVGAGDPQKVNQPGALWHEPMTRGQIDIPLYPESETVPMFRSDPRWRLATGPAIFHDFIGWNQRSPSVPWLGDRRVRQAFAHVIDLDAVIEKAYYSQGRRLSGATVPQLWATPSGLNEYRFDLAAADRLMREAGFTKGADAVYARDGRTASMTLAVDDAEHYTRPLRRSFALFAQESLRRFGIATNLTFLTQEQVRQLQRGELAFDGFVGYAGFVSWDPHTSFHTRRWHSATAPGPAYANLVGYASPDVDRAIDQGRGPDCSIEARQRSYAAMNRILNVDQPYLFGVLWIEALVMPRDLRGLEEWPWFGFGYPDVHRWWWARPPKK